jgi:hypothetical protein
MRADAFLATCIHRKSFYILWAVLFLALRGPLRAGETPDKEGHFWVEPKEVVQTERTIEREFLIRAAAPGQTLKVYFLEHPYYNLSSLAIEEAGPPTVHRLVILSRIETHGMGGDVTLTYFQIKDGQKTYSSGVLCVGKDFTPIGEYAEIGRLETGKRVYCKPGSEILLGEVYKVPILFSCEP